MAVILGLSGSLRNARVASSSSLCSDLRQIDSKEKLISFLKEQGGMLVEAFLEANTETESYLDAFEKLRAKARDQGLSNSEAALACGLWSCLQSDCEIDYVSLARHFPPVGGIKHYHELKAKVLACDGLLISGPVYFGDRGSLVQSFLDFCHKDNEVKDHLQGKVYAGISVGAKRNGGQETTLIYQMLDMANMGMLSVGNDTQTTSQYGGTAVAGDIGKLTDDDYGIKTCLSTGSRIAHVAKLSKAASEVVTSHKVKISLLVLQDKTDRSGLEYFTNWANKIAGDNPNLEITLWDALESKVVRCIGCDICPIDVGPAEKYRCIITRKDDFFVENHTEITDADALLVCAYNPENRKELISVYQQYMERTRYIRRDNYLYSDVLIAPFVISELSARQNIHMRIMTSMVRHQTIIHHPIIGIIHKDNLINSENIQEYSNKFILMAQHIVKGRYQLSNTPDNFYQPVGYIISKQKTDMDITSGKLEYFNKDKKESIKTKLRSRVTQE